MTKYGQAEIGVPTTMSVTETCVIKVTGPVADVDNVANIISNAIMEAMREVRADYPDVETEEEWDMATLDVGEFDYPEPW